eukprot:3863166-Rhodomonas_salina.1
MELYRNQAPLPASLSPTPSLRAHTTELADRAVSCALLARRWPGMLLEGSAARGADRGGLPAARHLA